MRWIPVLVCSALLAGSAASVAAQSAPAKTAAPANANRQACRQYDSNAPVTVTAAPTSQASVVGSNVTFSVTATGTGLSYQWLFGGSVIGTGSSLTLNSVTTSQITAHRAQGKYSSRKKPASFVIKRNCEPAVLVGLNKPPFQFCHVPPRSVLN